MKHETENGMRTRDGPRCVSIGPQPNSSTTHHAELTKSSHKHQTSGRLVVLELDPYPQSTFYDRRSGHPMTQVVVDYLIRHQASETNVFA